MTLRGLLLDFYGTVVHEDDAVIRSICERIAAASPNLETTPSDVATVWSQDFTERCAAAVGDVFETQRSIERASLSALREAFGLPRQDDGLDETLFAYWQSPEIFDDARRFLRELPPDVKTCVVSNIDRIDIDAAIAHHGLVFDAVVTSEEAQAYKPAAAIFELALETIGLDRHEVVHVGDSLSADVAGAGRLGIPTVWMNRLRKPLRPGFFPDIAVFNFDGLAERRHWDRIGIVE